ncbi:MAG: hypothetical protein IJT77_02165 [Clostridia bacterium]|nr:hypothetical protein [Clostridia bacterium]
MKKICTVAICLMFVFGMAAALADGHTVEFNDYMIYFGSVDSTSDSPLRLYFMDGVYDLPYLEVEDMAGMLWFITSDYFEDSKYDLTIDDKGTVVVLERENGYEAELDFEKSRITFNDYDAFIHNASETTLIDLLSENGYDEEGRAQLFQRDQQKSFDRYGDVKVFDLAAYKIELIMQDGKHYIPLQTVNDIFFNPPLGIGLLFNGEALFLANDNQLFDYGKSEYTELADIYYSVPTGERSKALAEYSYNELCLALDNFYGLKETHGITSFAQTFWEIGLDEQLASTDAREADYALKQFIDYYLDDLHSVFNEFSAFVGLESISSSTGLANRMIEEHSDIYSDARAKVYGKDVPGYEEVGNTAYITFDSFDSEYYGFAYYNAKASGESLEDTIGLIIYAHSQITRENSPIQNVVLDLSNNMGGAVDAAVFVLGWYLGDAPFSVKDMSTGAMSTSVYRADVNLDRTFDQKDTVSDKNLYCLISPVSFSCANLVPAVFKSSQKVTLLGRTSGGGSCIVQPMSTAYGSVFQISSALRLSFPKNGAFYDIDQGVEPDYYINSISNFYDRKALTDYINSLF